MARRLTSTEVAAVLRRQLLNGEFVGDSVREEEIAAAMGVSRTPVREAIHTLIGEGLLVKEHSRTDADLPSLPRRVDRHLRDPRPPRGNGGTSGSRTRRPRTS